MVLQRNMSVPVFGTADPGVSVTVNFQNQSPSVVSAPDGSWQVNLGSMAASAAAGTMTVSAGTEVVTFTGVQVGEVWVCSGQSNMGFSLSGADDGAAAIADSGNHNVRLFRMTAGNGPATTTWVVANSATTPSFSAAGWWMAQELSQWFGNVPIGMIQATHDGTNISEWQHTNGGSGADYDAMVKPIQPFAIKGVTWYQGESNGGDSAYETKLGDMLAEWRADWGLPALPFGIVQLHWRSGWTAAREAQMVIADTDPNAYLVVTTDLAGSQLHPSEKKPIGHRLAIGARGLVYGEAITYSSPIRDAAAAFVSGDTVVLPFKFAGGGLTTSDGLPAGPFKVAAGSGQYKTATAVIVGSTVQVSSSSVSAPTRVRYQWTYGAGNLRNTVNVPIEGGGSVVTQLPASQFELTVSPGGGDTTPPTVPTGLSATAGDFQVSLDWNDNVEPDFDSYTVKRATSSGGPFGSIASGLATSAHVDNTVNNGTTYYYVVSARDASGNESANSAAVSATPNGSPCSAAVVFIYNITPTTWNAGQGNKGGSVAVTVIDDCGIPAVNAVVSGTFTGDFNESVSGATNVNGIVVLNTNGTAKGNVSFTFCVDNVAAALPYDSASDVESCDGL